MQKEKVLLQEDGYSIHTFSARYSLSKKEFDALFENLKETSDHEEFYKPKGFNADCWVCNHFSDEGLLLYLSKVPDDKGYVHYVVTCRINPRKLIDPNCSYYGIMSMDRKSLDRMEARFQKILHKVGMDQELNDGTLSRLDLCANLMFPLKKLPKTIMLSCSPSFMPISLLPVRPISAWRIRSFVMEPIILLAIFSVNLLKKLTCISFSATVRQKIHASTAGTTVDAKVSAMPDRPFL